MNSYKVILVLVSFIQLCITEETPVRPIYLQPQQIHLSFGSDETQMVVTWVTFDNTSYQAQVKYGTDKLNTWANGTTSLFVDEGSEKRRMFIHRVVMTGLIPGLKYQYHCGSREGWSPIFMFTALKSNSDWSPMFAIYGDLGNVLGLSLAPLQDEAQQGLYDAILHLGDFAYDLHTDNARVGDEFFRQIETMAAYVAYQSCPGNHEYSHNFSNYDNRFSMYSKGSNDINNHYWSYNIGPAHIIAFSTEFYHFKQFGSQQIKYQYQWLEKDLIEANKAENREKHPWIITLGHRPFYGHDGIDENLRLGDNITKSERMYGLEDLFYKHGVDIQFWAHEHDYERLWPIYNNTIFNGSLSEPYTNPKAPVHIINGSAGSYMKQTINNTIPFYSAFRNPDFGYTVMTVHNKTHVNIEQISDEKNGEIVDQFYVIKEKHGSDAWL